MMLDREAEFLDGGFEVFFLGVLRARLDAILLGKREHFATPVVRDIEFIGSEFDGEAVVVIGVYRPEDTAVDLTVSMAVFIERLTDFIKAFGFVPEREVMNRTDTRLLSSLMRVAVFLDEKREQPTVSRIEKQVSRVRCVEVRLTEHQWHSEDIAVERNRVLFGTTDEGNVVHSSEMKRTIGTLGRHGYVTSGRGLIVSHGCTALGGSFSNR